MVRGLVGLLQRFLATGVLFGGGQDGLVLIGYCNLISGMLRNSIHCSNGILRVHSCIVFPSLIFLPVHLMAGTLDLLHIDINVAEAFRQ